MIRTLNSCPRFCLIICLPTHPFQLHRPPCLWLSIGHTFWSRCLSHTSSAWSPILPANSYRSSELNLNVTPQGWLDPSPSDTLCPCPSGHTFRAPRLPEIITEYSWMTMSGSNQCKELCDLEFFPLWYSQHYPDLFFFFSFKIIS